MPRYYCDYCDTYLTHDSPSVRKQHNAGYKHKANVRSYYQQFEEQQTQSLIDQRIKEHLGQAAAFQQQVGASFNQHLISLQANPQRPRLPILPPPVLQIGAPQTLLAPQIVPGLRPPVLPRPIAGPPGMTGAFGAIGTRLTIQRFSINMTFLWIKPKPSDMLELTAQGYPGAPSLPPSMAPPGAASMPVPMANLPRPPIFTPPASGVATAPATSGTSTIYQADPTVSLSATAAPAPQDGFSYSQPSETH